MTTWKTIQRAPNYEVSSNGQVRRISTGHVLTPVVNIFGYPVVCLRVDGKNYNGRIHKLVAWTFLAAQDGEVNHKNGNKLDNRVENLEFTTRKQNAEHAALGGLYKSGSAVTSAKLKESDIPTIWEMRDAGQTLKSIADHFHVSVGCICFVLTGGSWRKESEALGRFEPKPRSLLIGKTQSNQGVTIP